MGNKSRGKVGYFAWGGKEEFMGKYWMLGLKWKSQKQCTEQDIAGYVVAIPINIKSKNI